MGLVMWFESFASAGGRRKYIRDTILRVGRLSDEMWEEFLARKVDFESS